MKKFLFLLLSVLLFSSVSYGAVSQDVNVYVRQDVFDAKMESLRTEIQSGFQLLSTKMEEMDKRLSGQIAAVETHSYNRHEDLKTMIYWGFSILGLLIAFAIFAPSFAEFLRNLRKPSLTLEDVERMIAEAIAKAQLSEVQKA